MDKRPGRRACGLAVLSLIFLAGFRPGSLAYDDAVLALAMAHSGHELMPGRGALERRIACPAGGWAESTTSLEASVLEQNHAFVATTFHRCRFGDIFMDGALYNRVQLSYEPESARVRRERTITGHLAFEGGLRGTCVVDAKLTFLRDAEGSLETEETRSRGFFCGFPVVSLERDIERRGARSAVAASRSPVTAPTPPSG